MLLYFRTVAIKDRKQTFSFSLSKRAARIVREQARALGMTKSTWLNSLIIEYGIPKQEISEKSQAA